jgi:phosphoribosylglycinamide formyltransferase-1
MTQTQRIAIFASGSGSNFEALAESAQELKKQGVSPYEIVLLVCDQPSAYVLTRAERRGIPALLLRPRDYASREAYEEQIAHHLRAYKIDLIVLAGYMRLITQVLLNVYGNRILNIHPSLLPAFPGLRAVEQAYHHGVKVIGVTVHLVDEQMDHGPILAQEAISVHPTDTIETLYTRIHAVEHRLYPEVVRIFAEGQSKLQEDRTNGKA